MASVLQCFWLLAFLRSIVSMEVVVDDAGQIQSMSSIEPSPSLLDIGEGELECPVSEQVALGTKCKCEESCAAGKYCFAMEEGGTAKCQDTNRQDPSLLDVYGVTKNGPGDGKDSGTISGRTVKFYKKSASSGLRFLYSDNFRVYTPGANSAASRWEILVDGKSCPGGQMLQDYHSPGWNNPHRVNAFGGYCKGIGQGDHTVTVKVAPTPGYGAGRHDAYTGYEYHGSKGASWHLEVQEIPDDYALYHQKSGRGRDAKSTGIVSGRTLTFKKLYKDSRMRFYYSDNLRTHSGGYNSCRWTLKIDEQPCGSGNIAGDVYVHPHDNPHRMRSMVGYCDDISAGDHTVEVYVGTTTGYKNPSCYAGWLDSHYLLEAEEIPKEYQMVKYVMKHTSDGRDSGVLPHYRLLFTKTHAETRLRLLFTENLRSYKHHACACKWELLVDGKHCPNAEIFGQVYAQNVHHRDNNPHRFRTFGGFCENLAKGSHTATVNVKQQGPSCDCYTGWNNNPRGNGAHGLLEVHEFFKPCAGFDKGDCKGAHCYWSEKESRCMKANACPGHDKIGVGSNCLCGEKEATKGQFCYEDKTVHEEAKPEPKSSAHGGGSLSVSYLLLLGVWLNRMEV